MPQLVVTSILDAKYKDDLEHLLFFNENQARASEGVSHVVERYGAPRIVIENDRLRVALSSSLEPQTLFAITPSEGGIRPVGVVVYTREEDQLVVLFVAVDGQYTSRGNKGHRMVFVRMINELKALALRVRGIASLLVYMGRPKPTRIRLQREPAPTDDA